MPCLNEARTVATCIRKARAFLTRNGIVGEVLIADNGSNDGSQRVATANNARVVAIPERGYGAALIGGIRAARGRFVIMGDADDSYDFAAIGDFVTKLREGYQLVMGNRFRGGILPGAMPPLHRYLGNPVLTTIGRIFFSSPCRDFHCGLRGFDRDAILGLDLKAPGMEFASEMVVKATLFGLRITEVPTKLHPDGRDRAPHLRSWRDGWRHLRFLLLFSPRWLFLYPGFFLFLAGLAMMVWLLPGPRVIAGVSLDIHSLFFASLAVVIGFYSILFWVFTKMYGEREGLAPPDLWFRSMIPAVTLERALVVSGVLLLTGLALAFAAVGNWGGAEFGELSPQRTMRLVIPSGTAILMAFQIFYGGFFISVLDLRGTRPQKEAGGDDPGVRAA